MKFTCEKALLVNAISIASRTVAQKSSIAGLEGIYVKEYAREQGIASRLMKACEDWARVQGCMEFASDCELDNEESLAFHLKLGFKEANRIICFAKTL